MKAFSKSSTKKQFQNILKFRAFSWAIIRIYYLYSFRKYITKRKIDWMISLLYNEKGVGCTSMHEGINVEIISRNVSSYSGTFIWWFQKFIATKTKRFGRKMGPRNGLIPVVIIRFFTWGRHVSKISLWVVWNYSNRKSR